MSKVKNLGLDNSLLNEFLGELRNVNIQQDSLRFRKNLERIGSIFAYEISKTMQYKTQDITTPLGVSTMNILQEQPILATILRAGLPLHQGLLNFFDRSENAFIAAYRKHHQDSSFEIQLHYMSGPRLQDKILILSDPMIASGKSMLLAFEELLHNGKPKHTHFVSIIASTQGIEYMEKNLRSVNCTIWVGAIDEELTAQSYIVPGLGDAGDLAFGEKLDE